MARELSRLNAITITRAADESSVELGWLREGSWQGFSRIEFVQAVGLYLEKTLSVVQLAPEMLPVVVEGLKFLVRAVSRLLGRKLTRKPAAAEGRTAKAKKKSS